MTMAPEDSARRLAEEHGLRFVDLSAGGTRSWCRRLRTRGCRRQHRAVPIGRRLGTPVVAVSDPGDAAAMEALRQSVGREFVAVVAGPDQVDRAIEQLYSGVQCTFVSDPGSPIVPPLWPVSGGQPGDGNGRENGSAR